MPKANSDADFVFYTMRFPKDVWAPLKAEAQLNDRPLAREIIHRLRQTLPANKIKRRTVQSAD